MLQQLDFGSFLQIFWRVFSSCSQGPSSFAISVSLCSYGFFPTGGIRCLFFSLPDSVARHSENKSYFVSPPLSDYFFPNLGLWVWAVLCQLNKCAENDRINWMLWVSRSYNFNYCKSYVHGSFFWSDFSTWFNILVFDWIIPLNKWWMFFVLFRKHSCSFYKFLSLKMMIQLWFRN